MSSRLAFAARYVAFAAVATAANLVTQEATLRALSPAALLASLLAGTVVGFGVKYLLDKQWIFFDPPEGGLRETRKVLFYTFFSVFTTMLFWCVEAAFWFTCETSAAKYTGAVLGLAIGYAAKFELDRRYTFRKEAVTWS